MNGVKQDRYATILIYLNTVMQGGETEFPGNDVSRSMKRRNCFSV